MTRLALAAHSPAPATTPARSKTPSSKHETVHTYGWYMRQYVQQAKVKGPRSSSAHSSRERFGRTAAWFEAEPTATADGLTRSPSRNTSFIDLNEIIARQYDTLGEQAVEPLFADPHTHTSLEGARINAKAVITGLKLLKPDPLAKYFSAQAAEVPSTMPAAKL